MADTAARKNIYNIPAGLPFADTLAAGLLDETGGDPLKLADMRIFLPTRRACRVLRESFLRLSDGKPLLLPRMQPIGDVHDDEPALLEGFALEGNALTGIPPAMPPLRRQMLLARYIMATPPLGAEQPEQALALAGALGRLLDQMNTENKDIATLKDLVPGDETHWQITVKFLSIVSDTWPPILDSYGMIDASARRNRLMIALADSWRTRPPSGRVIAAGTTGSIPATANLLDVIAGLPRGAVVLPGLDQVMDDDSWDALDDTHPQATLRQLLSRMGAARTDVQLWRPDLDKPRAARRWLAAELMRPAQTSDQWQTLHIAPSRREALINDLSGHVELYECETAQDEARLIAVIIRHTIETPRKTIAVITPDRRLARRVAAICARWGIAIDDSGGSSLSGSPAGSFLRLSARAAFEKLRPAPLLALLRHPYCTCGQPRGAVGALSGALEIAALRGPKPPAGFEGLRNRLAAARTNKRLTIVIPPELPHLIDGLEGAMAPFMALLADGAAHPLETLAAAHVQMAQDLSTIIDESGATIADEQILWAGDDGSAAAALMTSLLEHGAALGPVTGEQYVQLLDTVMTGQNVRSPTGLHPRIFILGQLEARLVQADITIMAGLNEGTWPPAPSPDPWLSRTMRQQAGLPTPERSTGLSAHDFVQGFCAPRTILTRAKRQDGAQAVPARWLQRLDTVLQALQIDPALLRAPVPEQPPFTALARLVDSNPTVRSQNQPAPIPPVALRPRSLSVTEIETWLRDPYAIYAKHVLRLPKLDELEKAPDAAERGTLLHDALRDFVAKNSSGPLPADAADILYDMGVQAVARRADDAGFWDFWLPRYRAICNWFIENEKEWRAAGANSPVTEQAGRMTLPGPAGDFTLRVRADRIDRVAGNRLAVIDYKSGNAGKYSDRKIADGHLPQLPLTALILRHGGFPTIAATESAYLGYWVMTGGSPPGATKSLSDDVPATVDRARDSLTGLITAFDRDETPYIALPRPDHLPQFNDYDHLARVQEWTALGDSDNDAEDAA